MLLRWLKERGVERLRLQSGKKKKTGEIEWEMIPLHFEDESEAELFLIKTGNQRRISQIIANKKKSKKTPPVEKVG